MITKQNLKLLTKAALQAGFVASPSELKLLTWNAGKETHIPKALEVDFFAVYIFQHKDKYLKVGKASGPKNNDRYRSHHYIVKASTSNLAKSLTLNKAFARLIGKLKPREWIITKTTRYNILIPKSYGRKFVNFAEAFFILKCNPMFEA